MRGRAPALGLAALCVLFAGAVYQWPQFSENQNVYFLTGLGDAGFGAIAEDWRARQVDITPVFSAIVTAVHLFGHPWMYYGLHALLLAGFAGALYVVVSCALPRLDERLARVLVFAMFTLVHSEWLLTPIRRLGGILTPVIGAVQQLALASMTGMAGQDIPGDFLQPSSFGMLLLVSLALFVRGRDYAAAACAAAAATMHSAMILQAGFLVGAYMIVLWRERRLARAWRVGAISLILILPIVTFIFYWLVAVDGAAVQAKAQEISVYVRQPHHTQPAVWFSFWSAVQLVIIAAGLWISRTCTRLFLVMSICTGLAAGLTLVQIMTGSNSLAVMFPWRTSVWLVPLGTMLMLGRVAVSIRPRMERPWVVTVAAVLVLVASVGIWRTVSLARVRAARDRGTMFGYVQQHVRPGQTYLVPTEFAHFRLATGAPIFIDFKGFPYGSAEILEWDRRVRLARAFYTADSPEEAAAALQAVRDHAPITHVVVEAGNDRMQGIPAARVVFHDDKHAVYELLK